MMISLGLSVLKVRRYQCPSLPSVEEGESKKSRGEIQVRRWQELNDSGSLFLSYPSSQNYNQLLIMT